MRPDFNTIKPDIFRGESGGDYNALFNYMNRSGGMFDNVKITDMTVDGALDFATLSGPGSNYASYVGIQNDGVKATPMGAYQVVGTTLRDAKRGLGLRGDELMTRELQDRIGRYIYDTQGTGAWAGYKGPAYGPANAKQEAAPMLPRQPQAPRGLLEQFGLQKMQPGAAGETGQKFYQRDSFKDLAGRFAVGLNSMKLRPDPNFAGMMEGRRQERAQKNSRNKTVEYLRANGMGQYADMVEAGQLPASQVLGAIMDKSMKSDHVVVGNAVVDRETGEVLYKSQSGFRPATPEEAARHGAKFGQIDIATGKFFETGKSSGTMTRILPDGTVETITGSNLKLTEGQGKATGFFGRAQASGKILADYEREGTDLYNKIVSGIPIAGNYAISEEYQLYSQAKRDFINAILRQESGAVIAASEFENAELQYFPQPGDSKETIAQKAKNRKIAIEGVKVAAGPGAQVITNQPANQSNDGKIRIRYGQDGKVIK